MGYTWELLDTDARDVVLTLARHQADGLTVAGFREAVGFAPEPAARQQLAALGYVLDVADPNDGDADHLELMDRGARWLQETAERPDVTTVFPDADTTERLTWGLLHRFTLHAKANGHGSLSEVLWSLETERN